MSPPTNPQFLRYQRQMLLPQIGAAGQRRLAASRVLLIGCGALGSVIAEQLIRSGVGTLLIADRDVVELTNLQRQSLFDESCVDHPKAIAAAQRLCAINASVVVDARVTDVHAGNIESLAGAGPERVDLILDGTDNVQTRYLINDVSVKHGIPWIYGGCVGAQGRFLLIDSPRTPCLACIFPDPPAPDELPTCDTAGVLGPAASAIASLQAVAALKILSGNRGAVASELVSIDFWSNRIHAMNLSTAKRSDCVCCGEQHFKFLSIPADAAVTLCGRGAVQVRPAHTGVDLTRAAARLAGVGEVRQTDHLLRCALLDPPGLVLTLFADGRLIVQGTADPARARALYARFIGA